MVNDDVTLTRATEWERLMQLDGGDGAISQ
jgi:hypothetical protein